MKLSANVSLATSVFFAIPFLGLAVSAQANDTLGTIETSGIVFKESKAIEMLSEDLTISQSRITVKYRFKNTSTKDITSEVVFPIPDVPVEIPFNIPLEKRVGKDKTNPDSYQPLKNPFDFKVKVQREPGCRSV